jgi:hypothetical protein
MYARFFYFLPKKYVFYVNTVFSRYFNLLYTDVIEVQA